MRRNGKTEADMSLETACRRALLLIGLVGVLPALGADPERWERITVDRGRVVEIDRASVTRAEAGQKVAWGRLSLPLAEVERLGYASVQALNRYDCQSLRFVTIKRVYLDSEQRIIREEKPRVEREIPLLPGTLDERLYREVCKPPPPADLARMVEAAQQLARKPSSTAHEAAAASPLRMKLAVADKTTEIETPSGTGVEPVGAAGPLRKGRTIAARGKPTPAPAASPAGITPASAVGRPDKSKSRKSEAVEAISAHTDWRYSGESGPERWGRLRPEWAQCSDGRRQSPIVLHDGIGIRVDQPPLQFDYRPARFTVTDSGHGIEVRIEGRHTLSVLGRVYALRQLHFHVPAEEQINGRRYPMSIHLVHADEAGRLAVVALPLDDGAEHPAVQAVWNHLPLESGGTESAQMSIDLTALLPEDRRYFSYSGSLTTPPCTEGVLWIVMKRAQSVSPAQIATFTHLYSSNARPFQPLGDRLVKESRD